MKNLLVTLLATSALAMVQGAHFENSAPDVNDFYKTNLIYNTFNRVKRQLFPTGFLNLFNGGIQNTPAAYTGIDDATYEALQLELDALIVQRNALLQQIAEQRAVTNRNQVNAQKVRNARDSCSRLVTLPLTTLTTGKYYFYNDTNNLKNWFQAKEYCRKNGLELASIETSEENEALKTKVREYLAGTTPDDNTFFWTGINDLAIQGTYYWTGTGKQSTYFDWLADISAPNQGCDEHCGEMFMYESSNNIHWNDRACSGVWEARFICELTLPCSGIVA